MTYTTSASTYMDTHAVPSSSIAAAGGRGQSLSVNRGDDRNVPHNQGPSASSLPLPTPPPQAAAERLHRGPVYVDDEHERSFASTSSRGYPEGKVAYLRRQLEDLLATGLYDDPNDPVVIALRNELAQAERLSAGGVGGGAAETTAASTSFASVSASVTSMEDALDAFYD